MKKTSEQKFKFDAVLRLPALHRHSCMPKQLKRYCALITLAAVTATGSFAANYNTSNGTTDWFTDTNYAPVGVPDAATAVRILTTTDVAAEINTPGALASAVELGLYNWPGKLVVGASGTLDVTGHLVARSAINGDQTSSLTNDGTITVGATLSSSGTSTFENNGTLSITSNIVMNAGGEASFTNDGAITLIGSLYSRGLGTFDNTSGGTLTTVNVLLGNDDAGADNTFTNTGDLDASSLIRLSDAGTGTFNMDGGTVDAAQLQVGTGAGTGTLNMNAGALTLTGGLKLAVTGNTGSGTLNMNGGTLTALNLDMSNATTAHLNLDGGMMTVNQIVMNWDNRFTNTIDITEGVLIATMGNATTPSNTWNNMVGQGVFTAYDGAGTVVVEYDEGTGQTTLSAILPAVPFPTLTTYVHGPELIPNSDFANLENKSVATNVHGLWYESNSFGDLTEMSAGAEANLIDWSFFYDDPFNITPLVGTPNVLNADTVAYPLDDTFLLDTWLTEDEVMLTSVSNYLNGMQSEDILDGVTIDADATYLFAVSGWTETDNTGGLATLTAALTTGGDATDTLSAVPGSLIEVPIANLTTETPLTVQLSGADLIAAQVNVMFNLVSTAALPGVDPAGLAHDNVIIRENFRNEDYMSKVRLDSVSLSTVLVPEWGDLNRDGVVDAADESYAQSFLDGTIDGGNDAAARIAAEMALSGGTSAEALAALNLTEFDISGDGTFDAADVALVLSLSGASMASTNVVFNGSDEFEIVVDGLIPTVNYHLKRTADLSVDYTTVTTVEATSATETFTDPTPPAGKAFYKVTN